MSLKEDLTGRRFGRLTVLSRGKNDHAGKTRWNCICDCGKTCLKYGSVLTAGYTKSCGCYRKELPKTTKTTHGHAHERLYHVWNMMKQRCNNPNFTYYSNYGDRGITVCDEWANDYAAFRSWAVSNGYDPDAQKGKCTIDRIDNSKGYSPDNCRWVGADVQANNTRANHLLEYEGEKKTLAQWARETNINAATINYRLRNGWPISEALTIKPVIGRNQEWRKAT